MTSSTFKLTIDFFGILCNIVSDGIPEIAYSGSQFILSVESDKNILLCQISRELNFPLSTELCPVSQRLDNEQSYEYEAVSGIIIIILIILLWL